MNFNSYTLCYTNEIQKNNILQTIKQYNTHVRENNTKHKIYNILHAKIKKIHNMSMRDKRYWTCVLGNEPLGIITCCVISDIDSIINYFFNHNIACIEYFNIHKRIYKQKDIEHVDLNTV